jgi:tetratricopeptide (TPR) repeat protein
MITSASIEYISRIMENPHQVSASDSDSIRGLIEMYPYFVPARFMDAANQHQKAPFSPAMMDTMQLYMGNWLMYCQFLQSASDAVVIPTPPPPAISAQTEEPIILPVYTEDYFLHQGMQVSNDLPENVQKKEQSAEDAAKGLMVMMSFSEWLNHFKSRKQHEADEEQGQKAVKTMWQKEKLAAALEEENEEIPEKVFEMAVNSIANEDDLASESLAEVHLRQGRFDKAIEMYRKLSLRNPQKKAYFARKIETILKDK